MHIAHKRDRARQNALTSPVAPAETIRFAMLSKNAMAPKRALDQMWREASVDRAMRKVIEGLPDNRSAVRAMTKVSNGPGDLDGSDLQRLLVDPEMDLAPDPPFRAAVLAGVPLTFALHLDAGAVHQQAQRAL